MEGYSWIKDRKSAMIATGLMGLLAGMGMAQPVAAGLCAIAAPLLGVMSGPTAGLITVFLGMALPQVSLAGLNAPMALHLALAGYGFLIAAAALWAFSGKKPFFKALMIQWAAMALGVCLILMGLRSVLGDNLFAGFAQWTVDSIQASPNGDAFLQQALEGGLAFAPKEMLPNNALSRSLNLKPLMTPVLRVELAASLRTTIERELYAQLPGAVVTFIAGGGLLALCWPVCRMKKHGMEPELQMPAFESWHLPRGYGVWTAALLAGYVIQLFAVSYWELYWGAMLTAVFQWIYMIQGAAYWEYAHKRMGGSKKSRRAFVALTGVFIPFLLVMFGVLDQRADKRELREKTEED